MSQPCNYRISHEPPQRLEGSPMVLWVSRWAYMLFPPCPARFVGAPMSSPYLSWDRPSNSNTCILLSTALSAFCLNARFCATTFPLFVDENMSPSPRNSSSLSSGMSPLSAVELLRRLPSSSASPADPPAFLSSSSLTFASLSLASFSV